MRRETRRRCAACAVIVVMSAVALMSAKTRPVSHPKPAPSPAFYDSAGVPLRVGLSDRGTLNLPRSTFPKRVSQATLAAEDARFYSHHGVDPLALIRATWQNLSARRVVSGGSTLTMQYAKMLDPGGRRDRTLRRKTREIARAVRLERTLSKDEILSAYLNRAPYGGNLEGIEIASRIYFGHPADELSIAQAALLAALPRAPGRLDPIRYPDRAIRRRNHVLDRMAACGFISAAEATRQKQMPLGARRHPLPFLAPHFCDAAQALGMTDRRTSLRMDVQSAVERRLSPAIERYRTHGISQSAAVVLDVRTGAVVAMVGSADYHDAGRISASGQVNGAMAPRSPGSALKPFLYALAFDRGLISPSTFIADVPSDYAGIEPRNYNRKCMGFVRADVALLDSLNLPAVRLLDAAGTGDFLRLLRNAGLTTLNRSPDHYGLGIVIGGGEVTLLDLTNACAALARGGVWMPYTLSATPSSRRPRLEICSAEAAYLVRRILENPVRFGRESPFEFIQDATPTFAWKTGTSNGHRDAWTVGWNPEFAVGVWFGNFDNRPSEKLVGAEIAAPVVAQIFEDLYRSRPAPDPAPVPAGLSTRAVCARSGYPPGLHCPATRAELQIAGVSPAAVCPVHRVRPGAAPSVFERWPAEIDQYLRTHGLAQNSGADPSGLSDDLRIRSPVDGRVYGTGDIVLQAATSSPDGRLFWFVDGMLFTDAAAHQPLVLRPDPGRHRVSCLTRAGASETVQFVVADPGCHPRGLVTRSYPDNSVF